MYALGLFISLLIGIVLGLVGGGGSILTVPLVRYVFGESMLLATTYSLFVVAVAAAMGTISRAKSGQVDFPQGVIFVIPSMITAFCIRLFIMPLFPIQFSINNFELSREIVIATLLIVVMIFTALKTLLSRRKPSKEATSTLVIVLFGILTGLLSGFIGAGGGFIIVPILLRMGLDMKKAVGTSMFIIAIQSGVALAGDAFNEEITSGGINWPILLLITLATVIGVLFGTYLQRYFSGKMLRKVFSMLLICVAVGIAFQSFLK
ncbi:MAG: sulfite exporter TauE/SafE family protein [Crocinitomicaceae bacterium]|nr:sulfite exporter TauE/SafE family protein [Crocinitomicaceae bacterium]